MKIQIIHTLFILSFTLQVYAQKEYNMWYFGDHAGINFNTNPPTALLDSKMFTWESSTSMCDKDGNLLFYTNGDTIYNRKHQLMLNWKTERGYAQHSSAIQGSLILPVPKSSNLYYIFLGFSVENYSGSGTKKDSLIRYWIIDMKGDGGMGEVISKDLPLIQGGEEGLAIAEHSNGIDYWIAGTDYRNDNFNCIRTTDGQFLTPGIQQKLNLKQCNCGSEFYNIKFSPDSKIFMSKPTLNIVKKVPIYQYFSSLNLYKFDNESGQISDKIQIPFLNSSRPYYIEFSPDSKLLYVYVLVNPVMASYNHFLYQYDLSVWDSTKIASSRQIIDFSLNVNTPESYRGLQLGPDGKIYCFHGWENKLSVINNPNEKGKDCNFANRIIDIGNKNFMGGPYYPSFWFKNTKMTIGNDITICFGDSLKLTCYNAMGSKIQWNTGDTSESILIKQQGIYSVKVIPPDGKVQYDTVVVKVSYKGKVYIGNDTAFCGKFSYLLNATTGFKQYKWNIGDTTMQVTVNSKGIYSVKVLDSMACPSADTIAIDEIAKPKTSIDYDTIDCKHVQLSVDSLNGLTYLWNTGQTNTSIITSQNGIYTVTASHKFCSNLDTLLVDIPSFPKIDLGKDTIICGTPIKLKTDLRGSYLWNTLETKASIMIKSPGKYWLTVSRNNCSSSDTIEIKPCGEMSYYIPNAFSPNGDKTNDVFKVFGSNIDHIEIIIFDRWGEKLIETSGKDPYWDGTYKNAPCQESAYFYMVKLKGKMPGAAKYLKGTVTLLR